MRPLLPLIVLTPLVVVSGFFLFACSYDGAKIQIKEGRVESTGQMVIRRSNPYAIVLKNNKVLVVGGGMAHRKGDPEYDMSKPLPEQLYDIHSGKFELTGAFPEHNRYQFPTVLPDGKVLFAGGGGYSRTAKAVLYNPDTGKFEQTGDLVVPRKNHAAIVLQNGKVLIAGGSGDLKTGALDSAELYDPGTGTFALAGKMTKKRAPHNAPSLLSVLLPDGRVLIAGGMEDGEPIGTMEVYDPIVRHFSSVEQAKKRRVLCMALLPNGRVLIIGEKGVLEIFNPKDNSFALIGKLAALNGATDAVVLPNGKLLITGSFPKEYANISAKMGMEIFDPVTNKSELIANFGDKFYGYRLVFLPNNKVLMLGADPRNNYTSMLYVAEQ